MAVVTSRYVHPTIGNTSWGLPVRAIQLVFATLVMSLSAYTLSVLTGWREVRFTVAAGAWAMLSLTWIMTSGMSYRPRTHHFLTLALEFINWAMFLAVWIAISVNIGRDDQCRGPLGGHLHTRYCNTIYSALAFAIIDWILFTVTFVFVGMAVGKKEEVVHEKGVATGPAVRPSDDGTLRDGNTAV